MTELSVTISLRAAELAANCVEACANDPTEPERYREWYAEVAGDSPPRHCDGEVVSRTRQHEL